MDTRRVESQERRALEKLSAEMARCFYRSVYINQTGRTQNELTEPAHPDREADARQMEYE